MKKNRSCGATIGIVLLAGIVFILGLSFLNSGLAESKVGTIVLGALLAGIPLLSLVWIIAAGLGRRFRWPKWVAAIISLSLSVAGIAGIAAGMRNLIRSNLPDQEILTRLKDVCRGNGVAEAASYVPGQAGPYHIVVLKSSGQLDKWSSGTDPEWIPESIEQVELVLCLEEAQSYSNNACGYQRTGQKRDVRLVNARTGETVAEKTLECSLPPCVLVKSGATDDSCSVNFRHAESWVNRVLNE